MSIVSMPGEGVIFDDEIVAIVLLDNLEYLPLPSESIMEGLQCIASHDISLTQMCSHFKKSAEHHLS